jgi:hypothetical protein
LSPPFHACSELFVGVFELIGHFRPEILDARIEPRNGLGLDLVAIELFEDAIFLDGTDRAGKAGGCIQLGRLLNGKGKLVVRRTFAAGRRSCVDDTAARLYLSPVIPTTPAKLGKRY